MGKDAARTESMDFEALVREGRRPVARYLLAHTNSSDDAGDLVQETFVRAYCALREGRMPKRPIPWLVGIARNVLVDAVRRRRREQSARERLGRMVGMQVQIPWPARVDQRVIVREAIDGLRPELREPLLLHYLAELSVTEVADLLQTTAGAVKTRLWRAREALRGELEVLVSEVEKQTQVSIPADRARNAKLVADTPPVYDEMEVGLHLGGCAYALAGDVTGFLDSASPRTLQSRIQGAVWRLWIRGSRRFT